jgi:hypothetical protein
MFLFYYKIIVIYPSKEEPTTPSRTTWKSEADCIVTWPYRQTFPKLPDLDQIFLNSWLSRLVHTFNDPIDAPYKWYQNLKQSPSPFVAEYVGLMSLAFLPTVWGDEVLDKTLSLDFNLGGFIYFLAHNFTSI